MKNYLVGFVFLLSFITTPSFVFALEADIDPLPSSGCVSLDNNLRYKSRDISTNGEVSVLQDFLQSKNYLSSAPTGYFGLITLKATKDFQSAYGISPTGYVGPITRAKISSLTCGTTAPLPPVTTNPTSPVTPTTVNSTQKAPIISFLSPSSATVGDTVYVYGTNFNQHTFAYLDGDYGPSVITKYISPTSLSFVIPSTATGNAYNIYVNEKGSGLPTSNSALLTIITPAKAPTISYIAPSSVTAGQTVFVYGNNFNQNTFVTLNGDSGSVVASTLLSPTSLSFVIPANTTPSNYKVQVNEKGRSFPLSNLVILTVTSSGAAPIISSATPTEGRVGSTITLIGSGFIEKGGVTVVEFLQNGKLIGSLNPSYVSPDGTQFQFVLNDIFTANMSTGLYQIRISNYTNKSNTVNFTINQ